MYTRAKKILASEFMYALDKDEEGAEEYIDGLLGERFGDKAPQPPESGRPTAMTTAARATGSSRPPARATASVPAVPKALAELAGRPLVAWSLDAFDARAPVDQVVVAAPPGHEAELQAAAQPGLTPGWSRAARPARSR